MSLFTLTVKALSRNHIASTSRIDRRNALFLLYSRIPPVRNSSDTAASRPGPPSTAGAMAGGAQGSQLAPSKRPSPRCAPPSTAAGTASRTPPQFDPQQHAASSTSRRPSVRIPARPIASRPLVLVARPQSHFLSQSYETILSTSLTVHSLYRPELVQLEDLLRFLVRRAPIQPRCVASHDVGFTGRGTPSPDAPQRVGPPALVR